MTEKKVTRVCRSCAAFTAVAPIVDGRGQSIGSVGMCRLSPPSCSPQTNEAIWPSVRCSDYCGAHRRQREVEFDLVSHLERQRAFSAKTFGPGPRTKGVVDHIRKELAEIEADPSDIMEWVDVVILAFDGAWRAGWDPAEIVHAIVTKQSANEARSWPDWRDSDPDKAIEHIREDN